jgi:chromosome segregation ATPase
VTARLEKLATRGRSAASFQPVMAEVARGAGLAKHDLEADPVAARGRIEEQAAALDRASVRIDGIEKNDDRRRQAAADADEIARKVQAMRSEGWLLDEPGADPDERLAGSRREIDLAGQLLDAGEIDGGEAHLERAERSNAEARGLLESIVSARTKVDEMLPTCTARLEALAARREQTRRSLEQMAAAYAEASWADVADNAAKADQGIGRVESLLAETRTSADRARQHYFRAVAVLDEAVRQEDWVEGLQAAVEDRRAEFDGLRASLPGRRDAVRGRVDRLERSLERQRTDRVRANERAREAGRLVSLAERGIEASRPDLRQVSQVLEAADTAAARGEEFAAEDERLARQAFEELEETDGLIRRVAAWYGEGVSPDVQPAVAAVESAKALLTRQRYEDSLKSSAEAARLARAAYDEATAEAERRRRLRVAQIQQRQLEESFARTTRGAGPWVIQLPGGVFSGPDPWRTMHGPAAGPAPSRSAESSWSSNTARGTW